MEINQDDDDSDKTPKTKGHRESQRVSQSVSDGEFGEDEKRDIASIARRHRCRQIPRNAEADFFIPFCQSRIFCTAKCLEQEACAIGKARMMTNRLGGFSKYLIVPTPKTAICNSFCKGHNC